MSKYKFECVSNDFPQVVVVCGLKLVFDYYLASGALLFRQNVDKKKANGSFCLHQVDLDAEFLAN